MAKFFKKPYNVNLPKGKSEVEEFGSGKKGLAMCPDCNSTYFKKSWHHNLENVDISGKKDMPIKFILCPACQMIKNKQYEGRLIIKNIPEKSMTKLEELIEGFCRRAYERDPMDRLLEIRKLENKKLGRVWEVTVTENQLANKLAKKIRDSFNSVKTKTQFNKEPSDVAEIQVEFKS